MDTATSAPPGLSPRWSRTAPEDLRAAHSHLPEDLETLRESLQARLAWIVGRDGLHLARSGEGGQELFERFTAVVQSLWGGCLEVSRMSQRGDTELLSLRSSQERLLVIELNDSALLAVLFSEPAPDPHKAYAMTQFAAQHARVRATHEKPAVRAGGLR
ncbi:roadblock/LC7 domain-containing protein [Nocardiopsis kunsanensis]|uniref:Roadblock/LAMTOR2 domain-containing protein n=1 Tax=Nocardiopsis kunsanensis TaxID=141693 RepID=A0A919CKX6_9ACTN|nr:roadblock/LC7 domain-containing protein [Nocardiopsis kunsanensis]GHD34491.1 hypothetical protein GCM10007147_40180 [Nocardiopsis kunsanensis]